MGRRKYKFTDLKELCRLCLTPGRKIGIFEEEGQQRQIGYKIRCCLPDLIYAGDPLPQSICPECLIKLENNYEFLQKSMKNSRIVTNVLLREAERQAPEVQKYITLLEMGMQPKRPTVNPMWLESDDSRGSSIEEDDDVEDDVEDDDVDWQLVRPLTSELQEEVPQIFVQDGPSNPFMSEADDLTLMNATEVYEDSSVATRNEADNAQEDSEADTAIENPETNASQPTAECYSSTVEEILDRIKQEPEEVDELCNIDEQEIEVTWLVQSADQEEDVLDINRVKIEPVPLSLAVVKQEPPEPAPVPVPVMPTNSLDVKEEALTSSAQSRTRSRTINVECSRCFLVFHRETEILRHRCIGVSQWYCEPCNKYYKTKETFSRHKRFSCPAQELKCVACDNIFCNKIQLARHQVIHLKVSVTKLDVSKLNTCKICQRTFISKTSLNRHETSHVSINGGDPCLNSTESNFPHNRAILQSTNTHTGHTSNRNVPAQHCAKVSGRSKKQYHCTVCKAVYTNQKLLNAHTRQHGVKNPHLPKKPVTFETESANKGQQERLQPATVKSEVADRRHSTSDRYTCIICRKSFDTQESLIEHKKLHTAARTALNTRPLPAFATDNGTLPASQWVCKMCGLDCGYSKVLWNHMHTKHSKLTYKCRHCHKTFSKLCSLKSHEKSHEPKLRCAACGKQYSTLKALEAHEQSKHVSPTAAHLCRKCNIKFDTRSALLIHARNHQTLPKGKNEFVSVLPKPPTLLTGRKEFVSTPSKVQALHTCTVCAKSFIRYDSLKRHERNHATGKHTYYPCNFCGIRFQSVPKYKAHTEKHFQKCQTCKQTFFTQDFYKHPCVKRQQSPGTSQATTVKAFKCELCDAAFGTQQARNSHMRIHRKNWKYPTQRMGNRTPVLKKIAQSSRNIPHNIYCPLCSKAFLSKEELQNHIKLLHPKK